MQRRFVDAIVSAHLVAHKPKAFRARSGNGRDILYPRETLPRKAVVRQRQARRRSLAAPFPSQDCAATARRVFKKSLATSAGAQDAGIMAVVPSGASAALPVRL